MSSTTCWVYVGGVFADDVLQLVFHTWIRGLTAGKGLNRSIKNRGKYMSSLRTMCSVINHSTLCTVCLELPSKGGLNTSNIRGGVVVVLLLCYLYNTKNSI